MSIHLKRKWSFNERNILWYKRHDWKTQPQKPNASIIEFLETHKQILNVSYQFWMSKSEVYQEEDSEKMAE